MVLGVLLFFHGERYCWKFLNVVFKLTLSECHTGLKNVSPLILKGCSAEFILETD